MNLRKGDLVEYLNDENVLSIGIIKSFRKIGSGTEWYLSVHIMDCGNSDIKKKHVFPRSKDYLKLTSIKKVLNRKRGKGCKKVHKIIFLDDNGDIIL